MSTNSDPGLLCSESPVRRLWCVMKAHEWSNLSVAGIEMVAPKKGPQYFIPIFDTREQALAWSGNDETHIHALEYVA